MPWEDKWEVFKFTKFINLVLSLKIGYRALWYIGDLTFLRNILQWRWVFVFKNILHGWNKTSFTFWRPKK